MADVTDSSVDVKTTEQSTTPSAPSDGGDTWWTAITEVFDAAKEKVTEILDPEPYEISLPEDPEINYDVGNGPRTFSYNPGGEKYQPHTIVFSIYTKANTAAGAAQDKANLGREIEELLGGRSAKDVRARQAETEERTSGRISEDAAKNVATAGIGITGAVYTVNQGVAAANGKLGAIAKGGAMAVLSVGGIAAARTFFEPVPYVKLNDMVQLHVNQPPQANYSASWDETSLGTLVGGFAGGAGNNGIFDDFSLDRLGATITKSGGVGEATLRALISGAAQIPKQLGGGDIIGGIEASTRQVANPYKEQLFKSMGFRKFGFTYKFAPRSDPELRQVQKIIQLFKYHMHPEKELYFLKYPSEFNIEYHYKGKVNENIFKVANCALTDLKVTYGSPDSFNSFRGTDGAPSEINMEMTFLELELLTNEKFQDTKGSY